MELYKAKRYVFEDQESWSCEKCDAIISDVEDDDITIRCMNCNELLEVEW